MFKKIVVAHRESPEAERALSAGDPAREKPQCGIARCHRMAALPAYTVSRRGIVSASQEDHIRSYQLLTDKLRADTPRRDRDPEPCS